MIQEEVIQQLWNLRYFCGKPLQGTKGEIIEIISVGSLNKHAGPDFFNARVRIDGTEWAGNVEMHIKSSDWIKHGHNNDPSYDSVVLHVVMEHDQELRSLNQLSVPTVEISNYLPPSIQKKYSSMMKNRYEIPCEGLLTHLNIDDEPQQIWIERLGVERLEYKVNELTEMKTLYNDNDYAVFYRLLCKYFGTPANTGPFERIAIQLPAEIFLREKLSLWESELLIYGTAGWLNETDETFRFFKHYQRKYSILSIESQAWKYSRMRPSSFPEHRLFQLANFMQHAFQKRNLLFEIESIDLLKNLWFPDSSVQSSIIGNARPCSARSAFVSTLFINVFIPFLFACGKWYQTESYCEKALNWLIAESAEKNHLLHVYQKSGLSCSNAFESQALIHLRKNYCLKLACLRCYFGQRILLNDAE